MKASIAALGHSVGQFGTRSLGLVQFFGALVRAAGDYPATTRAPWLRTLLNQIRFTAVQALPLLSLIAWLIGITVIVQVQAQAIRFGLADTLGQILTAVVVRELGPVLTAVIVLGRSGTAIAAELSTNTVLGEIDAMEAMGVDPLQYLVIPRIVGGAISVSVLTVFFNAIALLGGAVTAWILGQVSLVDYLASLQLSLAVRDLWLMLAKGLVFGAGLPLLCSYAGLTSGRKATNIPQSVTRGVVLSFLFIFFVSALFSVLVYL